MATDKPILEATIKGGQVQGHAADQLPDTCPICHHAADPTACHGRVLGGGQNIEMIFQCPKLTCKHLFIAYYTQAPVGSGKFQLLRCAPTTFRSRVFDDHVTQVSPTFGTIWNQAAQAEHMELDQIAGMGYRKALEFLVKDYLISLKPDAKAEIIRLQLGGCIAQHISDAKVKACAARATWLGNDETHYLRKWEDKDISDLKRLIDLTVHWIISEEMTKKYLEDMPAGKS